MSAQGATTARRDDRAARRPPSARGIQRSRTTVTDLGPDAHEVADFEAFEGLRRAARAAAARVAAAAARIAAAAAAAAAEPTAREVLAMQKEVRQKDGRRRIMPVAIDQAPTLPAAPPKLIQQMSLALFRTI